MADEVRLADVEGATSIHIGAEITDKGDLLISGQDLGEVPLERWGDSDYEYWLLVPAAEKDRLLLALLERFYGGNDRVVSELMALLDERGIRREFGSWA